MAVTRGQSEETNRQAGSLGSTGLTKEKEAAGQMRQQRTEGKQ